MYRSIISLWLSFAVLIFTRTFAFPTGLNTRPVQLLSINRQSSNGFVRIKDSHVDSLGYQNDTSAMLQLESSQLEGSVVVRIRSAKENSYLCLNLDGNLTVEVNANTTHRQCLFSEVMTAGYTTFQSKYNTTWYLGFKRNGKFKQPHNTARLHKAARFRRDFL